MVARVRLTGAAGGGTDTSASGHRGAAERQREPGARPPRRSRDEPIRCGLARRERRGAIAKCRCRSRRPVESRARFPRRRRSGCGGDFSTDSATGLPIYSLYGRSSAPSGEMLRGIDVMLVDLQDAGARYFTYLFTTAEVMKAAGRSGIRSWCSTGPTPSVGRCRGMCSIAPRRRRWDIWRCRCDTA